jgi:hypothetical protein
MSGEARRQRITSVIQDQALKKRLKLWLVIATHDPLTFQVSRAHASMRERVFNVG